MKKNLTRYAPGRLRLFLAATSVLALTMGAGATGAVERLESLEAQTGVLGAQVLKLSGALNSFAPVPPAELGTNKPILVAQSSRDVATLNVRLGQVEEQLRTLTGQVEGLQFQMTQMQTYLERVQEDYEFRFQQLEGSSSGKTSAAPQSGGDMLSGELPQNQNQLADLPQDLTAPDIVIDPVAEGFELDAGTQTLGVLGNDQLELSGQPLDLNFDSGGGLVTDGDAVAQYQAGYDAVVRGDYAFAEDQFRQFVGLFPDHPRAPDATNWLGEALILRGEYDEAADVLLTGFESYSESSRAPDLLLKLGTALTGAGEVDTACRTFEVVQSRFANISPSFKARLKEEMGKAQC